MDATNFNWIVLLIAVSAGLVLILRDWRLTVPALLLAYCGIALFLAQQQFVRADLQLGGRPLSTLVIIKLITGVAATAILAITAITFSREYNVEDLDEFSLTELRRAARRAQSASAGQPFHLSDYVVPFWTLVLAAIASLALPRLYPIGTNDIDFVWYWLGLVGLFTMISAADLLKVGLGLLLCVESMMVLYTAVARNVQVIPLALLSLTTVVMALVIAYLSGLLYGRLKTLELNELYRR
jgi:hypothetical protein